MGTTHLLQPDRIATPDAIAVDALVEVADGIITDVRLGRDAAAQPLAGTLLPGFVDLQVNGAGGRAVDEATPDALDHIARTVCEHGAAAFLPTLITAEFDALLGQVTRVAEWIDARPADGAVPLGIHVEGPFLVTAGAHDANALVDPTPERVAALIAAGRGHIRLVTLAPSRSGAATAVATLRDAGITVSLGHGRGTEGIAACAAAGASMATHLFNAMGPGNHRDPGMAATLMDTPEITCCLIPDGHHVHPVLVRQALRGVGVRRTVLVTDCVAATSMPDGDYMLGTIPVHLSDGQVRTADGTLAGAAITMRQAGERFLEMVPKAGPWTLAQVAATNPARCIGANDWGVIRAGAPARFTLLADDGSLTPLAL